MAERSTLSTGDDGGKADLTRAPGGCHGARVIDRLATGAVVDFIDLHIAGWHWPAFNIADSAITVGAVLFILDEFRRVKREAPK